MSDKRKPWMVPIQYNDDRWTEPKAAEASAARAVSGECDPDVRDADEIEELLRRPDRQEDREYECNDTTPLDYRRGPHADEFGVEDGFDVPDNDPVPYGRGPHDDEFGDEDED